MKRKSFQKSVIASQYFSKSDSSKVQINHHYDSGEPFCMACGYYRNPEKVDKKEHERTYTCWNRAEFLEKCHIIPLALGGEDDIGNLILLCESCHKESPDTTSIRSFQIWIDSKSENTYNEIHEWLKMLRIYGISGEVAKRICEHEDFESLPDFYSKNSISHGARIATKVACLHEWATQRGILPC